MPSRSRRARPPCMRSSRTPRPKATRGCRRSCPTADTVPCPRPRPRPRSSPVARSAVCLRGAGGCSLAASRASTAPWGASRFERARGSGHRHTSVRRRRWRRRRRKSRRTRGGHVHRSARETVRKYINSLETGHSHPLIEVYHRRTRFVNTVFNAVYTPRSAGQTARTEGALQLALSHGVGHHPDEERVPGRSTEA